MATGNTYSAIVSWAKITLPILALGLLSSLFLLADRPNPEDALIFAEVDIAELARQQRLNQPRFAGTLPDGREILFQAEAAAPVPGELNRFDANQVSVRVELAPEDLVLLDAGDAEVDLSDQSAILSGGVELRRSDGMTLITESLNFAFDELYAITEGAVTARGRGMQIEAGGLELSERNGPQLLRFTGGVRVLYQAP